MRRKKDLFLPKLLLEPGQLRLVLRWVSPSQALGALVHDLGRIVRVRADHGARAGVPGHRSPLAESALLLRILVLGLFAAAGEDEAWFEAHGSCLGTVWREAVELG